MKRFLKKLLGRLFKQKRSTYSLWTGTATKADIVRAKAAMRRLIAEVTERQSKR